MGKRARMGQGGVKWGVVGNGYGEKWWGSENRTHVGMQTRYRVTTTELVRTVGLEPTASASQAQRSSHLNYILRELLDGIEPPNNRLQNGSCSSEA